MKEIINSEKVKNQKYIIEIKDREKTKSLESLEIYSEPKEYGNSNNFKEIKIQGIFKRKLAKSEMIKKIKDYIFSFENRKNAFIKDKKRKYNLINCLFDEIYSFEIEFDSDFFNENEEKIGKITNTILEDFEGKLGMLNVSVLKEKTNIAISITNFQIINSQTISFTKDKDFLFLNDKNFCSVSTLKNKKYFENQLYEIKNFIKDKKRKYNQKIFE